LFLKVVRLLLIRGINFEKSQDNTKQRIKSRFKSFQHQKIGEKVTEVLEYNPGNIFVKRTICRQYILWETEKIIIPNLSSLPISKGNAGASLLAYLLVSKYVDHLPFDRLRKILMHCGILISKSTINRWFNKSIALLELLHQEFEKQMLQTD